VLGYSTQKIGKTHLNGGEAEHPLDHGFDQFLGFIHHTWDYIRLSEDDLDAYEQRARGKSLGILCVGPLERDRGEEASYENGFTTEIFTDEAVKTIKAARAGRPFFIELEYNAVHMPTYIVGPDYAARVGIEQPVWDRNAARWEFPYWDPRDISWSDWHRKWGHLEAVDPLGRKRYLANLLAMDDGVAKILNAIEAAGIKDNTIVVFLSDNGGTINTYSNNTPLRGYKYMFGEGGIRIPMIIAWPGRLAAGRRYDALVSGMDVFPTLIELAGGRVAANLDGKSLAPLLVGRTLEAGHEYLCWADGKGAWVVRKGPWKLIYSKGWTHANYKLEDGIAFRAPEYIYPPGLRLFNLDSDIGERHDLGGKHPEIVADLKGIYLQWQSEMGKPRSGKVKNNRNKKASTE